MGSLSQLSFFKKKLRWEGLAEGWTGAWTMAWHGLAEKKNISRGNAERRAGHVARRFGRTRVSLFAPPEIGSLPSPPRTRCHFLAGSLEPACVVLTLMDGFLFFFPVIIIG